MFFYELHEGDDEVYSDVLVVSESEWEPQEFFDLVQRVRREVQDAYDHDTLIEAIAIVLERDYGFVFVSDDRLVAAVNVSDRGERQLPRRARAIDDETTTMMTTTTTRTASRSGDYPDRRPTPSSTRASRPPELSRQRRLGRRGSAC